MPMDTVPEGTQCAECGKLITKAFACWQCAKHDEDTYLCSYDCLEEHKAGCNWS